MANYLSSCKSKMQQNWVPPLKILLHQPLKHLLTKFPEVTLEEGVCLSSYIFTPLLKGERVIQISSDGDDRIGAKIQTKNNT